MARWQRLNNKLLLGPVSQFSLPLSPSEAGIPQPGSAQLPLQQVQLLATAPPGVWGQLAFCAGEAWCEVFTRTQPRSNRSPVQAEVLPSANSKELVTEMPLEPLLQMKWISLIQGPHPAGDCGSLSSGDTRDQRELLT